MCGIAGYILNEDFASKEQFHFEALNRQMRLGIKHRGPDSQDAFFEKNVALFHSRLSIQDLSSFGNQPMQDVSGDYVLVYNGEVYNHRELRETLKQKDFVSSSDTETLLYGLIERGEQFLDDCNGIFSLALFRKSSGKLLLARDPLGVKPLYILECDQGFFFSSEIKSFPLQYRGVILGGVLYHYNTFMYGPLEETPFENVTKHLAGKALYVNSKEHGVRRSVEYSTLWKVKSFSGSYLQAKKQLDQVLREAVGRQLLSDVPVGFFLSGGVDSSLLVALTRSLFPNLKIVAFTVKSEFQENNGYSSDYHYARIVADKFNVELIEISGDYDPLKSSDTSLYYLDEPNTDPSAHYVDLISKKAKSMGIKVLLGGTGGDDIFSGYRRHHLYYNLEGSALKRLMFKLSGKLPLLPANGGAIRRLNRVIMMSRAFNHGAIGAMFRWSDSKLTRRIFRLKREQIVSEHDILFSESEENYDNLTKLMYVECLTFLQSHNLNYTDKMGMKNGVEIRVPLLDLELVKFAFSLPGSFKVRNGVVKAILKDVAEDYLGSEIVNRPKTGFGTSFEEKIDFRIFNQIRSEIGGNDKLKKLLNIEMVESLLAKHNSTKALSYQVLSLRNIVRWVNMSLDKSRFEKELIDE